MTADAIAIHGHVYQPPRADPRTGIVPVEPTAAPFHDWNARITAECYRPNAYARIYDERGRVVEIVNNYGLMSFDLGPTLAHWLAEHQPDVLARMVAGDAQGRTAVAHPFHHAILPLCCPEDARTELRWGAADFRHRFGREPEGTWLPETAVDGWVLDLLAAMPRVDVAEVRRSAWSCAHGLGRWQEDCSCSTDGHAGWNQRWRRPLRDALDVLRAHSVDVFVRRGRDVFHDPWAARDAFGEVLADPGAWSSFVDEHVRPAVSEHVARALLDSQEATLASFTSCAWFFADLARREVAIVLQEALRSVELLRALGESPPLDAALGILAGAESNDPDLPTGREVWDWATIETAGDAWSAPAPRPLERTLTDLVERSLAGDGDAQQQAVELIDLLVPRLADERLGREQERVYDAITADPAQRQRLAPLGDALGLAASSPE